MATQLKATEDKIQSAIYMVRGHKIMLDSDLASIYQVETRVLNQAVKRNKERFPGDFMFQLSAEEFESLKLQFVTSKNVPKNSSQFVMSSKKHRGAKYLPYAFTEHGAVMLASVLNSQVAVQASIIVVRAFVKLREVLATHKELANKIEKLENKLGSHLSKHDNEIHALFEAIHQLMEQPKPKQSKRRKIGFRIGVKVNRR